MLTVPTIFDSLEGNNERAPTNLPWFPTTLILLSAALIVSCSASKDSRLDPSSTSGQGGSGNSGNGGSGGENTGGLFGTGGPGQCSGDVTCTDDLSGVLCDGAAYQDCGVGEMCAEGECHPACEAAEINKSTVGCQYYAVNPDVTWSAGACYAVFVANTWSQPIQIDVEFDGQALDASTFARIPSGNGQAVTYQPLPNGELPAGEIAILFLAQFGAQQLYTPACPAGITPAVSTEDAALHGTGIARSFLIQTSAPVVTYDIFPYGGGWSAITSATLLFPTSAWGDNYIAVAPYKWTQTNDNLFSWIQIIAAEDGTDVTISPTAAILDGGGITGTPQGTPKTYPLQKGQVLQFTQDEVLTGSPIQATKPIAVVGGNRCMVIPANQSACDAGHQMIPPVSALGFEYAAARYRDRHANTPESPPWRILGAVDGTTLTYEPSQPPGAPSTIGSGEIVEFNAPGPFVVRSQGDTHPFYMSAHMTGCSTVGSTGDCRGDPETVNVVPTAQYLNEYVFFTDPTYPETNLVFIRKKTADGFKDVELDCLGTLTGWQPINADYEVTRIDLVTGNFQPVGTCDNGRREATSEGPFSITVWGWGSAVTGGDIDPNNSVPGFYSQFVSYAYPAGAGVKVITQIEVPPVPR